MERSPPGATITYDEWVEQNPLRIWRLANGVSQFSAAVSLGVTPNAVSGYEHGRMQPRTEVLTRIGRLVRPDLAVPLAQARHDIKIAWRAWRDQEPEEE